MSYPDAFSQWKQTVSTQLPHLSRPQALVLALWSYAMIFARSCGTTLVLSSFNLSHSIFIRLKIRIDVHIALSYRYLLHIKDRTGRSQRSILHQFVV